MIALTFVLTDVGCYVGLRPKRSQSGQSDPQLRFTKEGDSCLRKLLVRAHRILSPRSLSQ